MISKPAHLTADNAARFRSESVVDLYHLRLPYPPEVFYILTGLIVDEPRVILDVGTGIGTLARALAPFTDRVDAVDISATMIAKGKTLPEGDHPHLRWIEGAIEDAPLRPPYALIVAGDSIHWTAWDIVFPRFADLLTAHGLVAIVERTELVSSWQEGLNGLIRQYSTMRNYESFDLIDELERRRLFRVVGRRETAPVVSRQPIKDYIASFHSRSSLSRDHMLPADADAFDQRLRRLVRPWVRGDMLDLRTVGSIVWGTPHRGAPA